MKYWSTQRQKKPQRRKCLWNQKLQILNYKPLQTKWYSPLCNLDAGTIVAWYEKPSSQSNTEENSNYFMCLHTILLSLSELIWIYKRMKYVQHRKRSSLPLGYDLQTTLKDCQPCTQDWSQSKHNRKLQLFSPAGPLAFVVIEVFRPQLKTVSGTKRMAIMIHLYSRSQAPLFLQKSHEHILDIYFWTIV